LILAVKQREEFSEERELLPVSLPAGKEFGTAHEAAEKVNFQPMRMTTNVSKFGKRAHIEFKREVFSALSQISTFSAACSAAPYKSVIFVIPSGL